MKVGLSEYKLPRSGVLLAGVLEKGELLATAKAVDEASGGVLARAIAGSRFTGATGQWLEVLAPAGTKYDKVLLAGLGAAKKIDGLTFEAAGGAAVQRVLTSGATAMTMASDAVPGAKIGLADQAARLALGAKLGGYRFDKYRTRQKPASKPSLKSVTVTVKGVTEARKAHRPLASLAEGISMTRDLVSEPPNVLYPESLAKHFFSKDWNQEDSKRFGFG